MRATRRTLNSVAWPIMTQVRPRTGDPMARHKRTPRRSTNTPAPMLIATDTTMGVDAETQHSFTPYFYMESWIGR